MSEKNKSTGMMPAFRHRNFRLFWFGQLFSLIGTHMQTVALGWLILRLTDSAFQLGLINTVGMLPILFFSLFAGILADRMNKRRLIIATQIAFLVQATALWALVATGRAAPLSLMILAALQGLIHAFDAPARQSFVSEMVPQESVLSAVALNSSIFNGARILGASAAGFLIHYTGESGCFLINALSYITVIGGLAMMRESELFRTHEKPENSGKALAELVEGFRYSARDKTILALLVALTMTSLFGMPSLMLLPVFAKNVLHVGARGLGFLFAAAGGGAVGAMMLFSFMKKLRGQGIFSIATGLIFSVSIIAFSQSKDFNLSLIFIAIAGGFITSQMAIINSSLQLLSPPQMRGRIMGIYIFLLIGTTPFGSFIMGAAAERFGAPNAVTGGGLFCFVGFIATIIIFYKALINAPQKQKSRGSHPGL